MADTVSDSLFSAVTNRMNITWELDEKTETNIRNAIEEAVDYLRKVADSPSLSFESGELRDLLITCSWYFAETKRAEFIQEYSGELVLLRLREGFGCGKESSEV